MNWKAVIQGAKKQKTIIMAIYFDDFGFMTSGELLEKTGLERQTLWRHLGELSDEESREGLMYLEAYRILTKTDSEKAKGKFRFRVRKSLRHPTLILKDGVYALHPTTRQLMDDGWRPYVPRNKEEVVKLIARRKKPTMVTLKIRKVES